MYVAWQKLNITNPNVPKEIEGNSPVFHLSI